MTACGVCASAGLTKTFEQVASPPDKGKRTGSTWVMRVLGDKADDHVCEIGVARGMLLAAARAAQKSECETGRWAR